MGTFVDKKPDTMVKTPTGFVPYRDIMNAGLGFQDVQAVINAQASDALLSQLEEQDVPDVVSSEDYFAQMSDTLRGLGIDPEQFTSVASGVDTGLENEITETDGLDLSGEGDESIVTDDPQAQWEEVDKDEDFAVILDKALDIFGAYNRDAISNVVDVVNDRGMSVGEVAIATGNTIESINQAAAESGTAIENQGLDDPEPTGRVIGDPFEASNDVGGESNEVVLVDDNTVADVPEGEPTVVMDRPADPTVVMDTPVSPEPTLTSFMPDLPKQQQTNITLLQNIMNETPITESILFPTEFTKLENVQQGMFERFLSAAGGNQ